MAKKLARHTRRIHSAGFNAHVALTAVPEDTTMPELWKQFEVHPMRVTQWK